MKIMSKTDTEKKGMRMITVLLVCAILAGCSLVPPQKEKKPAQFVVISEDLIPEELAGLIEEKKEEVMKLTYVDEGKRYIVIGYGKQKSGGYSIVVRDFYTTDNALYVDTCLLGPKEKPEKEEVASYPYLVLRTTQIGLPVVFK